MKKLTLAVMFFAILAGCNQSPQNTAQTTISEISQTDVMIYYFRGKARCRTCVAVGDVAKATVENAFANNHKVRFVEINTTEKGYDALIKKYEVTWNALIIAKGGDFIEITDQAFATAVRNPQSLEKLIKDEVNKRLQ